MGKPYGTMKERRSKPPKPYKPRRLKPEPISPELRKLCANFLKILGY